MNILLDTQNICVCRPDVIHYKCTTDGGGGCVWFSGVKHTLNSESKQRFIYKHFIFQTFSGEKCM